MIPKDEEFDVYVSEGVMLEVWRGEHLGIAQQFGVDWDGPIHSAAKSSIFSTRNKMREPSAVVPAPPISARSKFFRWVRALVFR
jgi:hypothetical protein